MMKNKLSIRKYSQISSLISVAGILIFLSAFYYATYKLKQKKVELEEVQVVVDSLKHIQESLNYKVLDLKNTQEDLLGFIGNSLSESSIKRIQAGVDWTKIQNNIIELPSGKRKQAILNAILLSWKEIPFSLGQRDLRGGFDSPRYIEYVLNSVDIEIEKDKNLRLSQNIMNAFKKTESPEIGDLMFYKGQVGYFGLIYLGSGDQDSEGVGIGTLQKVSPIGVYKYINTEHFPFVGYFEVDYEKL